MSCRATSAKGDFTGKDIAWSSNITVTMRVRHFDTLYFIGRGQASCLYRGNHLENQRCPPFCEREIKFCLPQYPPSPLTRHCNHSTPCFISWCLARWFCCCKVCLETDGFPWNYPYSMSSFTSDSSINYVKCVYHCENILHLNTYV